MKLTKSMPATPAVGSLKREFDTLFDRFFRSPLFPELAMPATLETAWEPALDLTETDKEYLARLEVPGFHKENLDVKFDAGMLRVTGAREFRNELKGEEFLWQEREEGKFARTIRIPAPVDSAKVEATYENGVLVVRLPKREPTAAAKIAIK